MLKPVPLVHKTNVVIQLRRKAYLYDSTRRLLELLLRAESASKKYVMVDYHLYMQAIYIEFNQRVTQIVFDTLLGVALFFLMATMPDFLI
jgi:hypothetical protein